MMNWVIKTFMFLLDHWSGWPHQKKKCKQPHTYQGKGGNFPVVNWSSTWRQRSEDEVIAVAKATSTVQKHKEARLELLDQLQCITCSKHECEPPIYQTHTRHTLCIVSKDWNTSLRNVNNVSEISHWKMMLLMLECANVLDCTLI